MTLRATFLPELTLSPSAVSFSTLLETLSSSKGSGQNGLSKGST